MAKQTITLYSRREPVSVEVETGSTISGMLSQIGSAETLVKNISDFKDQVYLPLDTKIVKRHTMLYLGKDPHDRD